MLLIGSTTEFSLGETVMKQWVKVLCLAVTLTCAQNSAFAAIIPFEDSELERLVRLHLSPDPGPGNVDDADVVGFTSFNSSIASPQPRITSLVGIERCTDLTLFFLSLGSFSDLTPLAMLPNLEILTITNNSNLSDLTPLIGKILIRNLNFGSSGITNLSPISGLTNITILSVANSPLTNLSPIASLVNLQTLAINSTNVSDISVLADLPKLEQVTAFSTSISDLTPLLQNTFFTTDTTFQSTLNVQDTNLTTGNCGQIGTLICGGVVVTDSLACAGELAAPLITGVDPAEGPETGGTEVTFTVDLLNLATTVMIGGSLADEVSRTDNSITVITPVHAPGVVDITIGEDDVCLATGVAAGAFTFKQVATSAVIAGTVLDLTGDPVTCAMVVILGDETENRVPTDLDGNFQLLDLEVGLLDGLPLTDYELQVYGPGIETITDIRLLASVDFDSETGQALGGDGQPGVEIVVTELMAGPGTSAAGRVIDLQIFDETEVVVALSGARIEAFEDGAPMVSPRVTFSCADGRFELAGLPAKVAANITLNVTAPEYEEQDGVEIPEDNSALEVIMIPKTIFPNVLAGLVLDADSATTIEGARVTVQPPSARLGLSLETANDGLYIVAVPEDGQYTVDVTAQDFVGQLKTTVVDAGMPISTVDFSLMPIDPGEGEGEGEGAGEPPGCGAAVSGGPGSHVWGDSLLVLVAMCVLILMRRPRRIFGGQR